MPLFDILKKLFKEDSTKPVVQTRIDRQSLNDHLNQELLLAEKERARVNLLLVTESKEFIGTLREYRQTLSSIDLSKRKEVEKLKLITLENLRMYLGHVDRLIDGIEKANEQRGPSYSSEIYTQLMSFENNSKMSFAKATILIGKELEKTRDLITSFLAKYNRFISEHHAVFNRIHLLESLRSAEQESQSLKQAEKEAKEEVADIDRKLKLADEDHQQSVKDLELLNKGEDLRLAREGKKAWEEQRAALQEEALTLKKKIDFKILLKNFHADKKKHELINAYRDNFLSAIEQDDSLAIASMVFTLPGLENLGEQLHHLQEKTMKLQTPPVFQIEEEIRKKAKEIERAEEQKQSLSREQTALQAKAQRIIDKQKEIQEAMQRDAKELHWDLSQ